MAKFKVTLLFKSGREVTVKCDDYSFTFDTLEYTGYDFKGMKPDLNFNPYELEGYIVR
jgi:hypothetical protein